MIEKGTIVVHMDEGIVQDIYCEGEARPFILADYDDQAIDKKIIREGTTDPRVPNDVVDDIEDEREKQAIAAELRKLKELKEHLRLFVQRPKLTDQNEWSICDYCGQLMRTADIDTSEPKHHGDMCIWARAKKAFYAD